MMWLLILFLFLVMMKGAVGSLNYEQQKKLQQQKLLAATMAPTPKPTRAPTPTPGPTPTPAPFSTRSPVVAPTPEPSSVGDTPFPTIGPLMVTIKLTLTGFTSDDVTDRFASGVKTALALALGLSVFAKDINGAYVVSFSDASFFFTTIRRLEDGGGKDGHEEKGAEVGRQRKLGGPVCFVSSDVIISSQAFRDDLSSSSDVATLLASGSAIITSELYTASGALPVVVMGLSVDDQSPTMAPTPSNGPPVVTVVSSYFGAKADRILFDAMLPVSIILFAVALCACWSLGYCVSYFAIQSEKKQKEQQILLRQQKNAQRDFEKGVGWASDSSSSEGGDEEYLESEEEFAEKFTNERIRRLGKMIFADLEEKKDEDEVLTPRVRSKWLIQADAGVPPPPPPPQYSLPLLPLVDDSLALLSSPFMALSSLVLAPIVVVDPPPPPPQEGVELTATEATAKEKNKRKRRGIKTVTSVINAPARNYDNSIAPISVNGDVLMIKAAPAATSASQESVFSALGKAWAEADATGSEGDDSGSDNEAIEAARVQRMRKKEEETKLGGSTWTERMRRALNTKKETELNVSSLSNSSNSKNHAQAPPPPKRVFNEDEDLE